MLDQPRARRRAGADDHVDHALGDPGLQRDPLELQGGERRELGGLEHHGVAAARAGASFHEAIVSGKFHGVISATTPSGSRNVIATPPATGIVSPSARSGAAA